MAVSVGDRKKDGTWTPCLLKDIIKIRNRQQASPITVPSPPQGHARARLSPDPSVPPRLRGYNRLQGRPLHLRHLRVVQGSLRRTSVAPPPPPDRQRIVRYRMTLLQNQIRLLGDPLPSQGPMHMPRAQAPLPLTWCPSMCTRAQHRKGTPHRAGIQHGVEASH